MQLPPELLGFVFQSFDRRTLTDLRQVCKSFDQAAVPYLFDRVYISDKRANLRIAELVIEHFGRHIRILKFSSAHYEDPASEIFQDNLRRWFEQSEYRNTECFSQHKEHAWKRYLERRAEWQDLHQSGEFVARLCFALSKIPRLRTIVITRFAHGRIKPQKSLESFDPTGTNSICPKSWCKLNNEQLLKIGTVPGIERKGSKPWHALMLALSVTKTRVEEIMSDHERDEHPLPCSAFNMSQSQAVHTRESFRCLKKLDLTLIEYEYYGSQRHDSYASGNVAQVLSSANGLEQLDICIPDAVGPTVLESGPQFPLFRAFIKGCSFPKLQCLILSGMESTEDELIDFLTASPGIEKLKLCYYELTSGLWEHLVRRIKRLLKLKTVCIPEASGGLPEPFIHVNYWTAQKLVEDFFLHDGANPFTKEALKRRHAESSFLVKRSLADA